MSGSGGGGGGPGPDGGPGCIAVEDFNIGSTVFGGYFPPMMGMPLAVVAADFTEQQAPVFDMLQVSQAYAPGQFPPTPYTGALQPVGFQTCSDCVVFAMQCIVDAMMQLQCHHFFVGQSGTLHVDQLTQSADAGVYSGALMGVHFVEYPVPGPMMGPDVPIPGGQCADLSVMSFHAQWP
jgi:hypothetical protein